MNADNSTDICKSMHKRYFTYDDEEEDSFVPYQQSMAHKMLLRNHQRRVRTQLSQSIDCHSPKKIKKFKGKRIQSQSQAGNQYSDKFSFVIKANNMLLPSLMDCKKTLEHHIKQNLDTLGKQKHKLQVAFKHRKYSLLNQKRLDERQRPKQAKRLLNLGPIKNSNVFLFHQEEKIASTVTNLTISRRQLKELIKVANVGSYKQKNPFLKNPLSRSQNSSINH